MFCENCGQPLVDNSRFCASCGNVLSGKTKESSTRESARDLRGLGGWLSLVIIGLLLSVVFQAYGVYGSVTLFTNGTVGFLSDPSSSVYIPGYAGLLKFELIAGIMFLVVGVCLVYLFFKKSKKFPKYYILFLVAYAAYAILEYALLSSVSVSGEIKQIIDNTLSEQLPEIIRSVASALIWGSYMKKSKRVKVTFVEV